MAVGRTQSSIRNDVIFWFLTDDIYDIVDELRRKTCTDQNIPYLAGRSASGCEKKNPPTSYEKFPSYHSLPLLNSSGPRIFGVQASSNLLYFSPLEYQWKYLTSTVCRIGNFLRALTQPKELLSISFVF